MHRLPRRFRPAAAGGRRHSRCRSAAFQRTAARVTVLRRRRRSAEPRYFEPSPARIRPVQEAVGGYAPRPPTAPRQPELCQRESQRWRCSAAAGEWSWVQVMPGTSALAKVRGYVARNVNYVTAAALSPTAYLACQRAPLAEKASTPSAKSGWRRVRRRPESAMPSSKVMPPPVVTRAGWPPWPAIAASLAIGRRAPAAADEFVDRPSAASLG